MLLIHCPHCGPRDEIEFRWGGDAHVTRPDPGVSDEVWTQYLFYRDNPKGLSFERWIHEFGCRRWFNIARDSTNHRILKTYPMGAPRPEIEG